MLTVGSELVRGNPWLYVQISVMGVLVNGTSTVCLKRVSGLTMKIVVCVRNLLVVWYGVVRNGDRVTMTQGAGYLVSVLGFLAYSWVRTRKVAGASKRKKNL